MDSLCFRPCVCLLWCLCGRSCSELTNLIENAVHIEELAKQARARRRLRKAEEVGETQVLLFGDLLRLGAVGGEQGTKGGGRTTNMRHQGIETRTRQRVI